MDRVGGSVGFAGGRGRRQPGLGARAAQRPVYHTERPPLSTARRERGSASRGSVCYRGKTLDVVLVPLNGGGRDQNTTLASLSH